MAVIGLPITAAAPPGGWPTPAAAYVHIPFCRHHCGYCNFTVVAGRDALQGEYLSALERELQLLDVPRPVDSLYVGGGTPTQLQGDGLARCLALCRTWFAPASDAEVTVEANPEDVNEDLLRLLRDAGVNRLSLGVQSFQPDKLRQLQRSHSPDTARHAVELAAQWIANISVDLIFAAPDERPAKWLNDLRTAVALPVTHISAYALTYERGSAFFGRLQRGDLRELPEDDQLRMYCDTREQLTSAGFEQYEVSNYARPGFASRHNQAYWQGRGWWAAGAGAARFAGGAREVNHRSTTTYLRRLRSGKSPVAERDMLSPWQWALERVAFGLRQSAGIEAAEIQREAGVRLIDGLTPSLLRWEAEALLHIRGSQWRLTERGLLLSDALLRVILETPEPQA